MRKTNCAASLVASTAALVSTSPSLAHHSASMFEFSHPIRVKGTVVRYEAVNPHAFFALETTAENGEVRRWTVEGPSLSRLSRLGLDADALKVGDVVEVCGFLPKAQWTGPYEGGAGPWAAPVMHGHLLFRADGRIHLWGPYGKLINCVQEADGAERWAAFLRSNPMAHDTWCRTQGGIFGNVILPPEALLRKIEDALADRCS